MGPLSLAIAEPQQQHCTFGSPPLSINAYLVHNELCPEPIFRALHCSVHSVDHVLHNQHLSTYIISLGGRPFHPSVPSSVHPSSLSRKKIMEEEEEWRQQQFIQMFM